jgi:hypothetical protein
VAHKKLPHRLRVLGWRILHADIKVGAIRMQQAGSTAAAEQFACQQEQCQQQQQPPLETISHALLTCPAAAGAWQWLAEHVWSRVQPGAQVDTSSAGLMLLDDSSVLEPPQRHARLWTHLRLLMLEALPEARRSGPAFTAQAIACRIKAKLQRQIWQDWQRVGTDIKQEAGVPQAWLNGPSPQLDNRTFQAKWGKLVQQRDGTPLVNISTASLTAPVAPAAAAAVGDPVIEHA